jgi:hypothetical protein
MSINWQIVDTAAAHLGASHDNRRKWRQSGRGVPPYWRGRIIDELKKVGIDVSFADFDALPENPGRIAA